MTNQVEIRQNEADDSSSIIGYALKFESWSKPLLNRFKEKLDRNCLGETDMSDTVALFNHDYNQVLGRVGANLNLTVDDVGLRFELKPTNTTYARDLLENMRAGVVSKCSFGFTIAENGQEWRKVSGDLDERTITKIDKLYDISIVTDPAYDDTEAVTNMRSYEQFNSREQELLDLDIQIYS